MKKFTLLIASLFFTIGAMAQTPVLELTSEQIGTSYPYELPDAHAQKVYALTDLTVAVRVNTTTMSGRRALFCTADPTQAANTDAKGKDSYYVAYGTSGDAIGYLASWKDGDRFTKSSVPANSQGVMLVYVINPSANTCKLYVNGTMLSSWVNAHVDGFMSGYEIATPGMVKNDYANAKIYIGGGVHSSGNSEIFNGTIREVKVYEGALADGQIQALDFDKDAARNELGELIDYMVGADNVLGIYGDKVGQRSSTIENWLEDFNEIIDFYNSINDTEIYKNTETSAIEAKTAELQGIIDSFTKINMPVSGKAYTFKNVQPGDNVCWFTYTNGKIELTTDENLATVFICRELENGKYAFAFNSGKYLIWRGSNAGYNSNSGVADAYDNTSVAYADFTVEKMTTANNYDEGVDMTDTRYVLVKGRRNGTGDNAINYFVVKWNSGTPVFDQANAPFYKANHNGAGPFSSAFILDEVEYANKPQLNNVGTSALITSDLHNKAMATFSAPFATVVPEGVTAYYATDGGAYVTLNAIDNGKAIPANTGVILVADNAGTIAMSPAAGEEEADNSNNVLSSSAGAAKEIAAGCYVLSAKNGVAGFYPTTAGTIAMNKAYIETAGGQSAIEIRLPGTTGIDEITDNRVQSTVIYDLTGRRVETITEPGIYIVNGVKKLVR